MGLPLVTEEAAPHGSQAAQLLQLMDYLELKKIFVEDYAHVDVAVRSGR